MDTGKPNNIDQGKPLTNVQKEIVVLESWKKNLLRGLLLLWLVANVFLFLRIFIRLFGADPNNIFAGFIYIVSGLFLLPFFGIIPEVQETIIAGQNKIDISAMIAWFCINILIVLIMAGTYIAVTIMKSGKQTSATVEQKKTINATRAETAVR